MSVRVSQNRKRDINKGSMVDNMSPMVGEVLLISRRYIYPSSINARQIMDLR